MCGHPFPHHRVGVIIKGPQPSSPRRFPSNVKRFQPSIIVPKVFKRQATQEMAEFEPLKPKEYFDRP